jgi:hypothetical protein
VDAAVQAQLGVPAPRAEALQRSHVLVQLHGGFHRAPAVALARLRPAEDGQHAVALDAHQRAAVRGHRRGVDMAQRAQQLGVVLGFHLAAEGGGSAEVAEQHAQPAARAFGLRA